MTEKINKIAGGVLIGAAMLGLLAVQSLAHTGFSSGNYIGQDDVQDGAGNTAASSGYGVWSAIVQTGIGPLASANYIHHAGFVRSAYFAPTSTPTPSPTATLTLTATATSTPTATSTLSATATPTSTQTLTPTDTPFISATPTATATASSTLTPEPTSTATPTATASLTATATLTASATYTITVTATQTATSTISPTATLTRIATSSPTRTATSTATQTPDSLWPGLDLAGKPFIAFPNPARGRMTFAFRLDTAARVEIRVYNLAGEQVAIVSGDCPAGGNLSLAWDVKDIAPGVYLARMNVNGGEKGKAKVVVWR